MSGRHQNARPGAFYEAWRRFWRRDANRCSPNDGGRAEAFTNRPVYGIILAEVASVRVALYARVSKVRGEQEPRVQADALRRFAEAEGWEVAGEYIDRAGATSRNGRREWARLLASARRGELDMVLCTKYDRTFRSTLDAASTVAELKGLGVGIRSLSESWLDHTQPSGKLVFDILAAVAEFERSLIRQRTADALAWRREHGTRSGRPIGFPPGVKRAGRRGKAVDADAVGQ